MKKENKCFFSIKLENGITITGNNPKEVQRFLLILQVACSDSQKVCEEDKRNTTKEKMLEYEIMFWHAWTTIDNNMKGE